jgi:hypothetical protein
MADVNYTNEQLYNAWSDRNFIKMDMMKGKIDGKINTNMMVDISLENGDEEMTKYLLTKYDAKPSLYAKQMAEINGHIKLAKEIESVYGLRNNVSIKHVHWTMDENKNMCWNECIPLEYRF